MGKIKMDLQAALDKDPAARNKFEIFFTYGGFKALTDIDSRIGFTITV